ncbi:CRP/FNR family cyclic AMP-dependent transcriptional regulator [Litorivivens lipolytica]|uniref:CRP/FNR family cyclic AMP-dependent transcriptional regulator n=1 Tax=Litorivivens lipolytica TaxID=1524264 RepID=A0A7W4W224_9GAMM|nr:Crp/Fnr family transcriptional regulator [Litorivivens lipolytica]MBB3045870.1 CRP/FNR family cyclic AMP-dependent transcriptional regulator [Litorivivens lipolytica]
MRLDTVDLFQGLSAEELEALRRASVAREFSKNSVVIHEGDLADSLYIIERGRVKVYCSDKNGKDFVLDILEDGDYFGELALLDDDRRSASVRAMETASFRVIYKQDFNTVLDAHPNIARTLIRNLTRRIRKLTDDVKALALQDVYGRVAKVLTTLAETDEDGVGRIQEKLTQQDIADRVGASREMVARILKDLTIGEYIAIESRQILLLKQLPESY